MNKQDMKIFGISMTCFIPLFLMGAFLPALPTVIRAEGQKRITLREAARQLGADRIDEYMKPEVLDNFSLPTKDEWHGDQVGTGQVLRRGG